MKDLSVVVYTMKGCPFCTDFKEMLFKENGNDMIPSLLIIEGNEEEHESFLYAPDRNYNELTEALDIIQQHRKNVGII